MDNRVFGVDHLFNECVPLSITDSPLLQGLPTDDIQTLLKLAHIRFLEPKDALFWESEGCSDVFLVITGEIKLFRRGHNKREAVIAFYGCGQPLGMESLFSHHGHPYSAIAEEESQVLVFPAWALQRQLRSHPALMSRLLSSISERQCQLIERMEWLTTFNAEQRLAAYLLSALADTEDGNTVTSPKKRCDLASLLGMTPETLCREIKKLKESGRASIDGSNFVIQDPTALQTLIGSPSIS